MTAGNRARTAKGKPRGRPFPKNNNANPSGRPKVPEEVRDILKAGTVPAARALVDIVTTGEDEHARIKAAGIILDRVLGKAPAAVEDREAIKQSLEVSDVRATLVARLAARLTTRDAGGGTGKPDGG